MTNIDDFRVMVSAAGPRHYTTKIKRNAPILSWVMERSAALPESASIADRTTFILEGELLINLLDWSKRNEVTYSQAQKMVADGRLPHKKIGGRVKVSFDAVVPVERIQCKVCGRYMAFITGTHLKQHEMTMVDYTRLYPNAPTVASDVAEKISEKLSRREVSAETRQNISDARSGITPKNHPRYVVGSYSPSPDTRVKMAESHRGLKHTEETKQKIGDAHRGKEISLEAIEKQRATMRRFYKTNAGFFTGRTHSEDAKRRMAEHGIARQEAYGPEKRAEMAALRALKTRGQLRTPEQKETYRKARTKWMSENSLRMRLTAGERTIKAWLDERAIAYQMQFLLPGESTANGYHPHDFFLPDFNTIIEFDGSHHWAFFWFNVKGKTDEEIAAMLERQVEKDARENWAVGQAGYRIIRIRGYADCGDSEWGTLEEQLELQGFDVGAFGSSDKK